MLKTAKTVIPMLLVIALTACGSSMKVTRPLADADTASGGHIYRIANIETQVDEVPPQFLSAINTHLTAELNEHDRLGEEADIATHSVGILVNDYRMRHSASRFFLGVLAGKDGVKSRVTVTDLQTGELLGESEVSTYNITAIGSPDDVARMHAAEIARFLIGPSDDEKADLARP